jgi:hypothetical protein
MVANRPSTAAVRNYGRLAAVLGVTSCLLLAGVFNLSWKRGLERADERATLNAIIGYDLTRGSLKKLEPREAAAYLAIYASTIATTRNPTLDKIADMEKDRLVQDIIAELRAKTGEDLGSRPDPWIRKYATRGREAAPLNDDGRH